MKSRGGRRDIQQKAEAEKFQVPSAHIYRTLFCGLSTCWILLTCSRLSPSKNIDQCKLQWISLILPHVSHFPKGLHHCSTFWSSLIHSTFLYHSDVPCSVLDGYWHFGGTFCLHICDIPINTTTLNTWTSYPQPSQRPTSKNSMYTCNTFYTRQVKTFLLKYIAFPTLSNYIFTIPF